MTNRLSDRNESLVMVAASPTVWAVHFLACYVTASVWCAKQTTALAPLFTVRVTIAVYTAVALLVIAVVGGIGFRAHRLHGEPAPHDDDTPEDRHRFMGYATLLLSGLSAVAVVFSALVAVFMETCQ